jgi:hypothetical protein
VSEWVIDKTTLQVLSGHDLMHDVWLYDTATQTYVDHNNGNAPVSFSRFCSADLPDISAFYNADTGLGLNPADGRLFLDGEESNAEGKPMAHIVGGAQDGNSYELAWLGNMAYENLLANGHTGNKTVVGMLNDTAATGNSGGNSTFTGNDRGEIYFYYGDKTSTGLAVDKAGLTNGGLFGISVRGMEFETDNTTKAMVDGHHFDLVGVGSGPTGADVHTTDRSSNRNQQPNRACNRLRAARRRRVGYNQPQPFLFRHHRQQHRPQQALGIGLRRCRRPEPGRHHQAAGGRHRRRRPSDVGQLHGQRRRQGYPA